ncbi:MAG: CotH kinase family protein [Bacteroidales bacterium]|nr:MAG: CotH kinase family protein [Bacteroidales bacterium]
MRTSIAISICLLFTQAIFSQDNPGTDIPDSELRSESTGLKNTVVFTTSNLPLLLINTQGKSIPDEPKITATLKIINNPDKDNNINDKTYEYDGYIGIEKRGNTAQIFFDKYSYTMETRTESGENLNVSLLGLPEENDWVLHGPYSDKSLMRNALAYHLGNLQGRWSPRTRFCEVFINDEYRGVFLFTEKIKRDRNRVDIATLLPEDISGDELTGGYILRIDRHREGCWISPFMGRTGSWEIPISYLDPKHDELTDEQKAYIKSYVTEFETALDGDNFKDPESGYRAYIDVVSFIDYFIVTEISRDLDGYRCSVYFHKDKDSNGGKLVASPLWDYNLGFGNGNFMDADETEGWTDEGIGNGDWGGGECVFWWEKLMEDPSFNARIKERWNSLRANKFSNANIFGFIDSCANVLSEAQVRNFDKFNILSDYVWPNAYIGGSYYNEIDYLKSWISQRLSWLDIQIAILTPMTGNEDLSDAFTSDYQVLVYPNPFKEKVTLNFNLPGNAEVDIIIRNILGEKIVHKSKVCSAGENEINIEGGEFSQSNNLFFYTLIVDGKTIQSEKLIKY